MIFCPFCLTILIAIMLFELCKQGFEAIQGLDTYHQVLVCCFFVIAVTFFLFYILAKSISKRTFYRKFFMFQRFRSIVLRYYDYYFYWISHQFKAQPLKFILKCFEFLSKIYFLISTIALLIMGMLCLLKNKPDYPNIYTSEFFFTLIGFVLLFRDWLNSNSNYTNIHKDKSLFKNIEPPNEWNRLSLVDDFSNPKRKEYVYINDKVNVLLQGNERMSIYRNFQHEENLKKQICNEHLWNSTFYPFLHQKYRETGYKGNQFYNEEKFGLSEDPEQASVYVHKTCYFDTYLTNIIPGNSLIRNCDQRVLCETEELMPYRKEEKCSTHSKKILYKMAGDGVCRSNEVGISTLFLIDGAILFWQQSPYALSSVNLIAPSGSGSADWDDCKCYFNEPNGLRKAVVYGMQRELWEESYSYTNQVSMKCFMNHAETRIIGYFRWLEKSAKPEFVGVTRICPNNIFESRNYIVPEFMEVKGKKFVKAKTIGEFLYSFRNTVIKLRSSVQINNHSVPSAMAVYFLKDICKNHCKNCLIGKPIGAKKKKALLKFNIKISTKSKIKVKYFEKYVLKIYKCKYKCPYSLQDILFTPDTSIQVKEH